MRLDEVVSVKRANTENWIKDDIILEHGEIGINYDKPAYYKIGDGKSKWSELPFYVLDTMTRADEKVAMFLDDEQALIDRKLFVHNLGELLQQTREGVLSAELDDNEIVTITFGGGATKKVNVNMDSYAAIIRDVMKCI